MLILDIWRVNSLNHSKWLSYIFYHDIDLYIFLVCWSLIGLHHLSPTHI